jgi:hypothetical protein
LSRFNANRIHCLLTHLVCPALNYVLTLTISLHNYSKFKAMGNLCLTKSRIIQITPFSSLSQVPFQVPCLFQSRLYGWIIQIWMTYSWHVFLFIHRNSSMDVSKIKTRIGGQTSITVCKVRYTRSSFSFQRRFSGWQGGKQTG